MTTRTKAHRASAQRRRAALLQAAAELAAEVGAGAVTHRAVAARAGVPLSTTSYFFGSIDELMTEALRTGATERAMDFEAAERVAIASFDASAEQVIDAVVDASLGCSRTAEGSQVEFYLAAGRQPELHAEATDALLRSGERIAELFTQMGEKRPNEVACAITAFTDGAMLHRLAGVDLDHRDRLRNGLRLLCAAATLDDDELHQLLTRYEQGAPAVDTPA